MSSETPKLSRFRDYKSVGRESAMIDDDGFVHFFVGDGPMREVNGNSLGHVSEFNGPDYPLLPEEGSADFGAADIPVIRGHDTHVPTGDQGVS